MKPDPGLIPSYLAGLAAFGVTLMETRPNQKSTPRRWEFYDELHRQMGKTRLDLASKWLVRSGVLFRPAGGLWILDCDDPITVRITETWLERQGIDCPRDMTPSGGCHFFFSFPKELLTNDLNPNPIGQMKHHVVLAGGKRWDFKLGERTAVVLPGTTFLVGRYLPLCPWVTPPPVDPREIEPLIEMFRDQSPWLEFSEDPSKRRHGAKGYLRKISTKPAISGVNGRKVLAQVACNLTRYYGQKTYNALSMLLREDRDRQNWNQRCCHSDGEPYPWSADELLDALRQSLDEVPSLGQYKWKERERELAAWRDLDLWLRDNLTPPQPHSPIHKSSPWLGTTNLFLEFLTAYDLNKRPPFHINEFSRHMTEIGYQRGRRKHLSAMLGVSRIPAPF
jgi:hypothetical protein